MASSDQDFNKLLSSAVIDSATVEELCGIIVNNPELVNTLPEDDAIKLRSKLNPYRIGPIPKPDQRQKVAASITNLREDYLRRFTATGMVSFISRMLEEYTVPIDHRSWVPAKCKQNEMFDIDKVIPQLELMLETARAIKAAQGGADSPAATTSDSAATAGESAAPSATPSAAAGLPADALLKMCALTYKMSKIGDDARSRLRNTIKLGKANPAIAGELANFPLPQEAGRIQMPAETSKRILRGFFDYMFTFDPAIHAKPGANPEVIRSDYLSRIAAAGESAPLRTAPQTRLFAGGESAPPLAQGESAAPSAVPQDMFFRWGKYMEVNYEELRTITEAIYPERPDLEMAIAIWNVFEGTDAEIDAEFEKFCQRYQDDTPSSIQLITLGDWTMLGDFKINREKIQFYNKNTEVLKRIIDRHTEDKKIGKDLLSNRIKIAKAANIAADGPDAPGLAAYNSSAASNYGGIPRILDKTKMTALERANGDLHRAREIENFLELKKRFDKFEGRDPETFSADEKAEFNTVKRQLQTAEEMLNVPDNAVQVDMFISDGKSMTKSHFYTQSFAPGEEPQPE